LNAASAPGFTVSRWICRITGDSLRVMVSRSSLVVTHWSRLGPSPQTSGNARKKEFS
jgi:hypothetical protein